MIARYKVRVRRNCWAMSILLKARLGQELPRSSIDATVTARKINGKTNYIAWARIDNVRVAKRVPKDSAKDIMEYVSTAAGHLIGEYRYLTGETK